MQIFLVFSQNPAKDITPVNLWKVRTIYFIKKKKDFLWGGGKLAVSQFFLEESSDVWLPNISCLLLMRTSFSVTRPCMFRRKRRYFKHVHQTSIQGKKQSRTTSFVLKVQRALLVRVPRKIVFTHEGTWE